MKRSIAVSFLVAAAASADVAYDNFGPGNTFTGSGFLVRGPQSASWWTHAFPFTAGASGEITTVTVAIQHLQGATNNYTLELRADTAGAPGAPIATLGQVTGFVGGTIPSQFVANPGVNLVSGTRYWLYAKGEADAHGTWRASPTPDGTRAYSFNGGSTFTVAAIGPNSGEGAMRIEVAGTGGGCYANCDGSTVSPVLTANDFTCYLTRFVNGESYADCDSVGGLTANDFACFLSAYAAGCS